MSALADELSNPFLTGDVDALRRVLDAVPHPIFVKDEQHRFVVVNQAMCELVGHPYEMLVGKTDQDFVPEAEAVVFQRNDRLALDSGEVRETEEFFTDSRGDIRAIVTRKKRASLANGARLVIGCISDVTEQKQQHDLVKEQEEQLRARNLQFDAALNNMSQGLLMIDRDERVVVCNDKYIEMFDLSRDVVKSGCPFIELLRHHARQGLLVRDPDEQRAERLSDLSTGQTTCRVARIGDGREILSTINPMTNGGWVVTHEDITEQRAAEAKISHMALHDPLTGLPNRLLFREQLEYRLGQMGRDDRLAVLCLDLDRFKAVNDNLGHPFGDMLLRQVGERLRSCLRESDSIARLGGDEFAILQVGFDKPTEITALAACLIEIVGAPFDLDGQQVVIGLSVGIAIVPPGKLDPDQLLKNADMALYRAKGDGRGTYRFFEPEMDALMQARRALELDLRKALINAEFALYYQPLVNLEKGQICGFEALLRWNHPERGLISPFEFIALAEETGLIVSIGEWVVRQACEEAMKWPSDLSVAVNLSPVQFKMSDLSQIVMSALAQSRLAPQRLELEITESVLLLNDESTLATLHRLRKFGVRISMDDFGTGYSSLSYLRSFPFDKIKIDGSFIRDLLANADTRTIIRAVIGLGNSLGMTTIGEGVETQEELDYLKREGCTEAQGYLFSQPKPASEVCKLLAEHAVPAKAAA